jgi:hypothetical protein
MFRRFLLQVRFNSIFDFMSCTLITKNGDSPESSPWIGHIEFKKVCRRCLFAFAVSFNDADYTTASMETNGA